MSLSSWSLIGIDWYFLFFMLISQWQWPLIYTWSPVLTCADEDVNRVPDSTIMNQSGQSHSKYHIKGKINVDKNQDNLNQLRKPVTTSLSLSTKLTERISLKIKYISRLDTSSKLVNQNQSWSPDEYKWHIKNVVYLRCLHSLRVPRMLRSVHWFALGNRTKKLWTTGLLSILVMFNELIKDNRHTHW